MNLAQNQQYSTALGTGYFNVQGQLGKVAIFDDAINDKGGAFSVFWDALTRDGDASSVFGSEYE